VPVALLQEDLAIAEDEGVGVHKVNKKEDGLKRFGGWII